MKRLMVGLATAVAVLVSPAAVPSAAVPAAAGTDAGPAGGTVVGVTETEAVSSENAGVACSVAVRRGAYTGYAKCNSTIMDITWSTGLRETVVVGTTSYNNIFHIYQRYTGDGLWSGWRPISGNGTALDGIYRYYDTRFTIYVFGTDWLRYCKHRLSNNTWYSGWYRCPNT